MSDASGPESVARTEMSASCETDATRRGGVPRIEDARAGEAPPLAAQKKATQAQRMKQAVTVFLFGTLLVVPLAMLAVAQFDSGSPFGQLITDHAAAMLGVPWAGGAASIVVLQFRATSGNIEFEVVGFKFTGASGPIVLWAMCFLVEVLAIRLLWNTGGMSP